MWTHKWNGEVVCRVQGITQCLFHGFKCPRIVIIATHILEQGKQVIKSIPVINLAHLLDAIFRTFT